MSKYQNAKIYKIVSPHHTLCYYGSTIVRLSDRLSGHKTALKTGLNHSSGILLKLGDCKIILVETFPCNTKEELLAREQYYIENNECINKRYAQVINPLERRKSKDRLYYTKNHDQLCETKRKVVECECGVNYTYTNTARHLKTMKHLKYLETGEKQNVKNNAIYYKEKIQCAKCAKSVCKINMNRHLKSCK